MILNAIPKNVKDFLLEIERMGFRLCLVGGVVRNYLAGLPIGDDFDFEVRFKHEISDLDWPATFELIAKLAADKNLKFEKLPYLIIRIYLHDISLEFSSPRIEKFYQDNHHHHNFDAILSPNFNYHEAYKRRDFTINAIGVEFDLSRNYFEIIDPFNGQKALQSKILEKISDDFFNDSVRFLRLVRFKSNFNFDISPGIIANIHKFNLTKLSEFHLKQEANKADVGKFFNEFIYLVQKNQLKLSLKLNFLERINFKFPEKTFVEIDQLIYFTIFVDEIMTKEFLDLLHFPKNYFSKLSKIKIAIDFFQQKTQESLYQLTEMSIEEFKNSLEYNHLKVLVDHLIILERLLPFTQLPHDLSFANLQKVKNFKLQNEIRNLQKPDLRSVMEIQEGLKSVYK